MARNQHVYSWPKNQTAGPRRDHGNFDRAEAEEFIRVAKTEHPDREYQMEQCQHPDHQL